MLKNSESAKIFRDKLQSNTYFPIQPIRLPDSCSSFVIASSNPVPIHCISIFHSPELCLILYYIQWNCAHSRPTLLSRNTAFYGYKGFITNKVNTDNAR